MKLAALYSVWNGEELLIQSIEQIYQNVGFVVICWQKLSNKGELSEKIEPFVKNIKGKKVFLVEFTPDLKLNTKQNERNKHNLMIEYAKSLKSTHFFFSATDHFYNKKEFIKAKKHCKTNNLDVTFTAMYTYYKRVTWRVDPIEDYFMPFICKLHANTIIEPRNDYPVRVDPAIQLNTCTSYYVFTHEQIMMHHFSMIRIDIQNKFRNAAASVRWNKDQVNQFVLEYQNAKLGDSITYFQGRKLIEVDNQFF